jgi:hypothetical protein
VSRKFGGYGDGVPPVPIPNTEVKPISADGTWGEIPWESRTPPVISPAQCGAFFLPVLGFELMGNPIPVEMLGLHRERSARSDDLLLQRKMVRVASQMIMSILKKVDTETLQRVVIPEVARVAFAPEFYRFPYRERYFEFGYFYMDDAMRAFINRDDKGRRNRAGVESPFTSSDTPHVVRPQHREVASEIVPALSVLSPSERMAMTQFHFRFAVVMGLKPEDDLFVRRAGDGLARLVELGLLDKAGQVTPFEVEPISISMGRS